VLHIPLALALLGIVCRGTAFVFRSAGQQTGAARRRWSRIFAIASTITPLLLGTAVGALATGAVGAAQRAMEDGHAAFLEVFVAPWLAPFPLAVGVLTVGLFALLAATYLTLAAKEGALREDFRRRALAAAAAVIVAVALTIAVSGSKASHPISKLWPAAALVAAGGAIWALLRRRFALARVAVAALVSLVLWGWAEAQYPYLVPPTLTIRGAAAGHSTLEALLWIVAGGGLLLIPSLAYLLGLFAKRPPPSEAAAETTGTP
jgi:cytochrome bd ubiquinol oxidase subunit II